MQYKHVPPAAVAAILAAGDIAITLLEVPTGRFADRFGHRCSLIVGSAIQVIGMLLCWLAEGVPGLVMASLCVALGDTFRSGADQALLYESCVAAGEPHRFQQIEAKTHSLELIALVALMTIGGAVVETVGFAAAWVLETLLAVIGVVLAATMLTPPCTSDPQSPIPDPASQTPVPPSPIPVPRSPIPALLRLLAPAALIGGAASAATFFAQTAEGASPTYLTVVVGAITLAEAAGAMLARYLSATVTTQYVLLGVSAVCGISMVIAPGVFAGGVVLLSLLAGAAEPLRATAIQVQVDRHRAEAASWASALDGGIRTLFLLAAGSARGRRGVSRV